MLTNVALRKTMIAAREVLGGSRHYDDSCIGSVGYAKQLIATRETLGSDTKTRISCSGSVVVITYLGIILTGTMNSNTVAPVCPE